MAAFPPLHAADYQDPSDKARKAAEAVDDKVAAEIDDGFDRVRDAIDLAALAAALASGIRFHVFRVLSIFEIESVLERPIATLTELHDAVAAGAMADVAAASENTALSGLTAPVYSRVAPDTVEALTEAVTQLVTRLSVQAEATVDQVIAQGLANRLGVDGIARALRESVGLTPRQAMAVENFRRMLETGDRAALDRALRDRRFDRSIINALQQGNPLSPEKIERMVERYAERFRKHRAEMIARTETLKLANLGRSAAWAQFAERKGLGGDDVIRFWQTAADERVCPVCRLIPILNPQGRSMGQPYVSPDGNVMMPPQHPACRCTERFQLRADSPSANRDE